MQRSRAAALHLDPVSLRSELATASVIFQDCKESMDSAIDPQLPAVEQTDVIELLVQLSESVELAPNATSLHSDSSIQAPKFLVKRQGREISVH
jgi:hypothetical protein